MKRISLTLLLFGIALSQFDVNFSLESKYGDGKKITNQDKQQPTKPRTNKNNKQTRKKQNKTTQK